jgi:hypothetical protein
VQEARKGNPPYIPKQPHQHHLPLVLLLINESGPHPPAIRDDDTQSPRRHTIRQISVLILLQNIQRFEVQPCCHPSVTRRIVQSSLVDSVLMREVMLPRLKVVDQFVPSWKPASFNAARAATKVAEETSRIFVKRFHVPTQIAGADVGLFAVKHPTTIKAVGCRRRNFIARVSMGFFFFYYSMTSLNRRWSKRIARVLVGYFRRQWPRSCCKPKRGLVKAALSVVERCSGRPVMPERIQRWLGWMSLNHPRLNDLSELFRRREFHRLMAMEER